MSGVIDVVVSCSNRKKCRVGSGLSLRNVRAEDLRQRASRWISNLRQVPAPTYPAGELYAGGHWTAVRSIASQRLNRRIRARVWICSAGYGLLPFSAAIKAYRATFSRGHKDSVSLLDSTREAFLENQRWWRLLATLWVGPSSHSEPRQLRQIPAKYGKAPMLVALSSDYLGATAEDLGQMLADPYYQENLSIISCGNGNKNELLFSNILPCDATMQPVVGGARVSLNVRVAAHLLRHLRTSIPSHGTFRRLCRSIQRQPTINRDSTRLSDAELEDFIRTEVGRNPESAHTKLLRILRAKRFSCEQSRFARVFRAVVSPRQRRRYA